MIKLLLDGSGPPFVLGNVSDTELLNMAEAYFPNPSPLLLLFMQRYERLLDTAGDQELPSNTQQSLEEDEEDEDPTQVVTAVCPSCGCQLIVQETPGE